MHAKALPCLVQKAWSCSTSSWLSIPCLRYSRKTRVKFLVLYTQLGSYIIIETISGTWYLLVWLSLKSTCIGVSWRIFVPILMLMQCVESFSHTRELATVIISLFWFISNSGTFSHEYITIRICYTPENNSNRERKCCEKKQKKTRTL